MVMKCAKFFRMADGGKGERMEWIVQQPLSTIKNFGALIKNSSSKANDSARYSIMDCEYYVA